MRKHLSLIIEHDDEERVGGVSFYETRKAGLSKNDPTPIQKYDEEAGDFYVAGKEVSLGYVDFEDEQQYQDNEYVAGEIRRKLREVDREWVERAGVEEVLE